MIWYVIEHIVRRTTGRIFRRPIKAKAYLADLQNFDQQVIIYYNLPLIYVQNL